MTGSLAILSEAGHSLIDLVSNAADLFCCARFRQAGGRRASIRPRQSRKRHRARRNGIVVPALRCRDLESLQRLIGAQPHAVEATLAAFAIIASSIVVDFFRARALNRVATATSSEALEADALHFCSDMWSSVAVLIGLAGVRLGFAWADAAAAIVVAVFICIAGWRLGRRTIDTLTDTAPAGVSERVAAIARQVPGVVAVERVRARPAGAVLFVDLGVA